MKKVNLVSVLVFFFFSANFSLAQKIEGQEVREYQELVKVIEESNLSIDAVVEIIKDYKIRKPAKSGEGEIVLKINYSNTLKGMIESGKYYWVDNSITDENFPIPAKLVGKRITVFAKLLYFGYNISSEKAIREMDRLGYRPAMLLELLAFGANYPDMQEQFPIISFGSVWRLPDGFHRIVGLDYRCTDRYRPDRVLDYYSFEATYDSNCRFLAIRKILR